MLIRTNVENIGDPFIVFDGNRYYMYATSFDCSGFKVRVSGFRLCVATSKPEDFAVQIMEHFGLSEFFAGVFGAAMDETRTNKDEVINYALETLGVTQRSRVLMVGDREYDILGAKRCGLAGCIGCLFGYGSREELTNAGAIALVAHPLEIAQLILDNKF